MLRLLYARRRRGSREPLRFLKERRDGLERAGARLTGMVVEDVRQLLHLPHVQVEGTDDVVVDLRRGVVLSGVVGGALPAGDILPPAVDAKEEVDVFGGEFASGKVDQRCGVGGELVVEGGLGVDDVGFADPGGGDAIEGVLRLETLDLGGTVGFPVCWSSAETGEDCVQDHC